jgi:hypothetical protein
MLSTSFSVPSELIVQTLMVPVFEFWVYTKLPSALTAISTLWLPAGLAPTTPLPIGVKVPFWARRNCQPAVSRALGRNG